MTAACLHRRRKVLLVNYAGYMVTPNTFVPDNSLATLAAVLRADGFGVEIVDLQNPEDLGGVLDGADPAPARAILERLGARQPIEGGLYREYRRARDGGQRAMEDRWTEQLCDKVAHDDVGLVGFKLWAGNGLAGAIRMAEALRARFPRVRLVAGGPAVNYTRATFFRRTTVFDALAYGDGEDTILALAREAADVPGVVRREGDRIHATPPRFSRDLDVWPPPTYARDVYPSIDRMFRIRIVDESRGCFNRCAFCSHRHLSDVTRVRSPARVADEMELGLREGVTTFRLSGSNPPRRFLEALAKELIARKIRPSYSVYSSFNNMRPSSLPLLAESGLAGMFFGLEAGDPEHLRRVHNKNNRSEEHILETTRTAMELGIFVALSVIVPSPFETEATTRATLSLLTRIFEDRRHGSVLALPAFLLPGNDWWERRAEFGFELEPGWDAERLVTHLLDWDSDWLLPRELAKEAHYRLNGKDSHQLFDECGAFVTALERAGIQTNIDDAAYMIALSGGLDPRRFKVEMCARLVRGGRERLVSFVEAMNAGAAPASHAA